jgi:DNA-binding IclR family transcriptional regulator
MQESVGSIKSVHRAMLLLGKFSAEKKSWGVMDLSRETGLHKSVVTRIMATMARAGFVVQDPLTRAYSIGPKAFAVGSTYDPQEVLGQIARPVMRRVTEQCGHATSLGVAAGDRFIYLVVVDGTLPVRVAASVGEVRDYHANATGKILLAGMSDAEIRNVLRTEPLPAHTEHTVVRLDRLMEEITEIRRTKMAANREEAMLGVGARAVPIVNAANRWIASLSIVYPIHLVDYREVGELECLVSEAGREISASLSR